MQSNVYLYVYILCIHLPMQTCVCMYIDHAYIYICKHVCMYIVKHVYLFIHCIHVYIWVEYDGLWNDGLYDLYVRNSPLTAQQASAISGCWIVQSAHC